MKRGSKKGLSPVIATVLLVFLVLILAAIIFLWASGFFKEQLQKNEESIENQCMKVQFKAEKAGFAAGSLLVLDLSNTGQVNLYAVGIKEVNGGDEDTKSYVVNLGAGDTTSLEFNMNNSEIPDKVVVYPILLGGVVGGNENKEYTCIENPTVVNL